MYCIVCSEFVPFRKLENVLTQQEKELLVLKREQSNLLIKIEELTQLNSKANKEICSLKESNVSTEKSSERAMQSAESSFQELKQKALTDLEAEFMVSFLRMHKNFVHSI